MIRRTWQVMSAVILAGVMMAGCGSADGDELQQWMTQQRAQTKARVSPISEPKRYVPLPYTEAGASDPFSSAKLTQALRSDSATADANAALLAAEMNRRKEPLENYPLDTMAMVGSLTREGQLVALVRADNLLYQVRPGNYLGQNYGRVTRISEGEVTLREIVQDAAGEWIERTATLQLQENAK